MAEPNTQGEGQATSPQSDDVKAAAPGTVAAVIAQNLPIAFTLHDKNHQPVVYLENPSSPKSGAVVTITNTASHEISFKSLNGEISESNFHFALHFRPGTLQDSGVEIGTLPTATKALDSVTVTNYGTQVYVPPPIILWKTKTFAKADGSYWICFLNVAPQQKLPPGGTLTFTFEKLLAKAELGSRGSRVALVYQNLNFTGETAPLRGTRTQHLSLVHRGVNAHLPIHLGFVGSNTILNNSIAGQPSNVSNSLTLRLTNLSGNETIKFQMPEQSNRVAPTRLILSFDSDETWGLGTLDEIKGITVDMKGWNWVFSSDGPTPQWEFTPKDKSQLASGESMELCITNIRSSRPSGLTNLYLQYQNLPDYTDGKLAVAIQKTALVERKGEMIFGGTSFKVNAPLVASQSIKTPSLEVGDQNNGGEIKLYGNLEASSILASEVDVNGVLKAEALFANQALTVNGTFDGSARDQLKADWEKDIESALPNNLVFALALVKVKIREGEAMVFHAPDGWVLCDGTAENYDLRPGFIDVEVNEKTTYTFGFITRERKK